MIESMYWREELRKQVAWLRRNRKFQRWSARHQVLFERQLLLVAFQIRVLLEHAKVGHKANTSSVKGLLYRKIGSRPLTRLKVYSFPEYFDFENPQNVVLSVRDLCNQLIHHYLLFAARGDRKEFEVVILFSDYKRHVCVYEFDVKNLLRLFAAFVSDSSAAGADGQLVMTWNERQQDYVWSTAP